MRLNGRKCHFPKSSIFPHGTRSGWEWEHPKCGDCLTAEGNWNKAFLGRGEDHILSVCGEKCLQGPCPHKASAELVSARAALTWRNWMQGRIRRGWPGWLVLVLGPSLSLVWGVWLPPLPDLQRLLSQQAELLTQLILHCVPTLASASRIWNLLEDSGDWILVDNFALYGGCPKKKWCVS